MTNTVKHYEKAVTKIRKILPNPLFKTKYTTNINKIIRFSKKIIETVKDQSGTSYKAIDKPPPDPPPIKA